jgi:hypothetical protein
VRNDRTANDPIAALGLTADQAAAIKAHFESLLAAERDALSGVIADPSPVDPTARSSTAALLRAMRAIHGSVDALFVHLEGAARLSAQQRDLTSHATLSRIAHCCAEFHHILGGALDEAESRQAVSL